MAAPASPVGSLETPDAVLHLQHQVGNRSVNNLIQSKRIPTSAAQAAVVQRQPAPSNTVGPEGGEVEASVADRLHSAESGGQPLPTNVRNQLEPKLGANLNPVRVHTGPAAAALNQQLGAKAFTHGAHIFYGANQSPQDVSLTAHETVHTIQQGAVNAVHRSFNPPSTTTGHDQLQRKTAGQWAGKIGLGGAAGLLGGIVGTGVGAVAGTALGGYNAMKATWQKLTKGKSAGHMAYAWLPALLAGVGGAAAGAIGGTFGGMAAGAKAGFWAGGQPFEQRGGGSLGADVKSEELKGLFGASTKDRMEDLPAMPTLEPGVIANPKESEFEIETLDNQKKKYKRDDITELTVFEYTDDSLDKAFATFYIRASQRKLGMAARLDFAKQNKYARGEFVQGHIKKADVSHRFNTMAVAGFGGPLGVGADDTAYPVFSDLGPTPDDINQGVSGQCWLLSPLMAMARRMPDKLREMIPAYDDKTATVRFFNQAGQPEYVRITRKIVHAKIMGVSFQTSTERGRQNSTWPMLILKAYAAWGGKGSRNFTVQSLDGGHGDEAFKYFIGPGAFRIDTRSEALPERHKPPWQPKGGENSWVGKWGWLRTLLVEQGGLSVESLSRGGAHAADFQRWTNYAEENGTKIHDELKDPTTGNANYITLEVVQRQLAAGKVANRPFGQAALRAYATIYPHGDHKKFEQLGVDRYTDREKRLFTRMENTFNSGGVITAGTGSSSFISSGGKNKGAKNSIVFGGIQQSHAYEVAGVRTDPRTGEKYVKLRNPWGRRKMFIVGDAEFELTFSKFVRRFDSLSFSKEGDAPQEDAPQIERID